MRARINSIYSELKNVNVKPYRRYLNINLFLLVTALMGGAIAGAVPLRWPNMLPIEAIYTVVTASMVYTVGLSFFIIRGLSAAKTESQRLQQEIEKNVAADNKPKVNEPYGNNSTAQCLATLGQLVSSTCGIGVALASFVTNVGGDKTGNANLDFNWVLFSALSTTFANALGFTLLTILGPRNSELNNEIYVLILKQEKEIIQELQNSSNSDAAKFAARSENMELPSLDETAASGGTLAHRP